MEQFDTEVVETVAGVARLLRRAAELVWTQADVAGTGSSHQLLALAIDSAADEASGLLPRRAQLDGFTPVGDNSAEQLNSAEIHGSSFAVICRPGATDRCVNRGAAGAYLGAAGPGRGPADDSSLALCPSRLPNEDCQVTSHIRVARPVRRCPSRSQGRTDENVAGGRRLLE